MASVTSQRLHQIALAALAAAGMAGCATATPPASGTKAAAAAPAAASAAASSASGAASAAAARPDPTAPKPFAEVIKDATREDGFIPVWRKDEKVWLEIAPDRLNQPLLVSVNIASSVGERGLYASQMGPSWLGEFRKVGNQVQLIALQTDFRGDRDAAAGRAVREAFSDSLIGSTAVASAAHPERKTILVDAGFLLGDMAGYSTALEAAFRLPFAADRANSYFESTRAEAGLTTLSGKVHYAVSRIPAPPLLPPGAPPPPRVAPPQVTGDSRSLFVGFVYNFRELPGKAQLMAPRQADPRVGHFIESYSDLSDDLKPNPRVHNIKRWRLEKKDPQAALSEPVKPITYWLDRNIPARYRPTVEAGVLEWNRAFERIGFKNAIVVKQQPDDANFDDMDAGHASIRWFVGADVGFAIGPSHADPRTGEIFDADIGMSDVFGRGSRRQIREDVSGATPAWRGALQSLWSRGRADDCTYAADAAAEMAFSLDLLEARGELDPDSPEAEAFVRGYIKDVIVHEVGHTLGLRHNFRASTTVTREQLKDKAFGTSRGISGSVMDYNAFNLPLAGEPKGEYNMTGLGPYDYWAIEYAYKPLPAGQEAAELQKIAARSASDPSLAFADDIDAGYGDVAGIDPLVNRFDLGDDPLAYYQKRFTLSKELWQRVQDRGAQPGDDSNRLRRSMLAGFRQLGPLPELAAKYVGGMYTERDLPGSGGRPSFRPVEPAKQRQALAFLTSSLFAVDAFRFKPEFLTTLAPDYVEYQRDGLPNVSDRVLALQTSAMDRLLAAGTAKRLLELPYYLPEKDRAGAISLNEVYTTLQAAVWAELKSGQEIDPLRRGLQRAHLARLQALLTRPQPGLPADAVSLARLQATQLQADLQKALTKKGLAVENRAHLQESLGALTEALKATMQRS